MKIIWNYLSKFPDISENMAPLLVHTALLNKSYYKMFFFIIHCQSPCILFKEYVYICNILTGRDQYPIQIDVNKILVSNTTFIHMNGPSWVFNLLLTEIDLWDFCLYLRNCTFFFTYFTLDRNILFNIICMLSVYL